MRLAIATLLSAIACVHAADASPAEVLADFGTRLGPMRIERMALGQGGLSAEPMWADRIPEIRALNPMRVRPIVLDALTPSAEESARLRHERAVQWKKGEQRVALKLEPYAVRFWSLE